MVEMLVNYVFRSSGDTLSRENFYKLKSRIAEARMLASGIHASEAAHDGGFVDDPPDVGTPASGAVPQAEDKADSGGEVKKRVALGSVPSVASSGAPSGGIKKQSSVSPLVMALRSRAADIRNGHMAR